MTLESILDTQSVFFLLIKKERRLPLKKFIHSVAQKNRKY